ncbi:helix-turn-helix transcriptional regulator [Pseudooceanicola sp. LIPI14-2-Ac024]|uniref:helix-turn-helix transcriptional regulator n=1 Tax=Pseudooceanicola sp. LIPI14-2-Ac024 TaxID=3344875 RepID=UPI0035D0639F
MNFGDLLDDWDALLAPERQKAHSTGRMRLPRPDLGMHFRRLAELLDRTQTQPMLQVEHAALAPYRRVAAFCVSDRLALMAVNDIAREVYDLSPGEPLARLPMASEDIETLTRNLRELVTAPPGDTRLLKLHSHDTADGTAQRSVLLRLRGDRLPDGRAFVVVVTSHLRWPEGLSETLERSYGLTASETEVLRGLTQSQSLREIADRRGRSIETVRAQIKSLQQKTELRSQGELVRLALSAMDVATSAAAGAAAPRGRRWSGGGATLRRQPYRVLRRPDGRKVEYLVLGDPAGRPVLYLNSFMCLSRWPAAAEAEAARRGLRIVVPNRAGYGGSCPCPPAPTGARPSRATWLRSPGPRAWRALPPSCRARTWPTCRPSTPHIRAS